MNDKERLQTIKDQFEWGEENLESGIYNLESDDINWLIEQVEKIEHLNLKYNASLDAIVGFVQQLQQAQQEIERLVKQRDELELETNDWRAEAQKWQKFYKESEESHLETKELLKSIVNQNKRYRVALENICVSPFRLDIDEAVTIAKQALEGEE